jgi:hypothetical protein
MENYYKRPSPQEQRYRDVLKAIGALGSEAKELADELDDAVWQVVRRAVDVAVADHDRQTLSSGGRSRREPISGNGTDRMLSDELNADADLLPTSRSSR